jgi:Transglycosylase SLT domain
VRRPIDLGQLLALACAIIITQATPSIAADDELAATAPNTEIRQAGPEASPPTPIRVCEALAAAAAANDLPVHFFTRLIWQESRFNPASVSPAGAQGIAQFMPETARLNQLDDPFNPHQAIPKSAQLLRDLHQQFGNLGLAAAAYNAGPGRVRDWLDAHRVLPDETQAYVRLVTGRTIEEWTSGQNVSLNLSALKDLPCDQSGLVLMPLNPAGPSSQKLATAKPWGVEVVGGPTSEKALARYREWLPKYAAIVGHRQPKLVLVGVIGQMGAVHVRVGTDTREEANKLCAQLSAAGAYCEVLREIGSAGRLLDPAARVASAPPGIQSKSSQSQIPGRNSPEAKPSVGRSGKI